MRGINDTRWLSLHLSKSQQEYFLGRLRRLLGHKSARALVSAAFNVHADKRATGCFFKLWLNPKCWRFHSPRRANSLEWLIGVVFWSGLIGWLQFSRSGKAPVNVTQTPHSSLIKLSVGGLNNFRYQAPWNKPITATSRPPARYFLRIETWKENTKLIRNGHKLPDLFHMSCVTFIYYSWSQWWT